MEHRYHPALRARSGEQDAISSRIRTAGLKPIDAGDSEEVVRAAKLLRTILHARLLRDLPNRKNRDA